MDLGAYVKIDSLSEIAEKNGISVPRLRGYRLMKEENPVSEEEIREMIHDATMEVYESAVSSIPRFRPDSRMSVYSPTTKRLKKKYLIQEKKMRKRTDGTEYTYYETVGFRWELIHGKNRKAIKFAIKKREKAIRKQYDIWNKYAGKEGILYIHARIGGGNWIGYNGDREIASKPWFLDRVDDSFDCTYCDIYAKIV